MSFQIKRDTFRVPEGMERITFSGTYRLTRGAAVAIPFVIAALILNDLPSWRFIALLIGVAGLIVAYLRWQVREKIAPCYDLYELTYADRASKITRSLVIAGLGIGLAIVISDALSETRIGDVSAPCISLVIFAEVLYVLSLYAYRTRKVPVGSGNISREPSDALEAITPEPVKPTVAWKDLPKKDPLVTAETMNRWFVRYPGAIALIALAYNFPSDSKGVWVPIGLLLLASILMYEILAASIVCALVYWFFGALAAVPTSVAVLIGAYWIAESNKKKD